jgi:hypothetical protein
MFNLRQYLGKDKAKHILQNSSLFGAKTSIKHKSRIFLAVAIWFRFFGDTSSPALFRTSDPWEVLGSP